MDIGTEKGKRAFREKLRKSFGITFDPENEDESYTKSLSGVPVKLFLFAGRISLNIEIRNIFTEEIHRKREVIYMVEKWLKVFHRV